MREYACIMLDYEQPDFIKDIQKQITDEELYLGETEEEKKTNEYGMEHDCHITICYGLPLDTKFSDIEPYLFPLSEYKTILVNVSIFENDKYDVLKVSAKCPKAKESNSNIRKNFDVKNDYPDFNAHMTIAYMKKGCAKKYTKEILDRIPTIVPHKFNHSYAIDGKNKNETHKELTGK